MMDMITRLAERHLTCSICFEVFSDPATLECGHTFCKSCILGYTKRQSEALETKSIPCAVCRQSTKVSCPEKPVDDWIDSVKPSPIVVGLLDDFVVKRRNKRGRSSLRSFPKDENTCTGNVEDFPCDDHPEELSKLFCKDCQKTACQTCCITKHKLCVSVVTIDEVLPEIKSSLEKAKEQLLSSKEAIDNVVEKRKAKMKTIFESTSQAAHEIKRAFKIVVEILNVKKLELYDELDAFRNLQMKPEVAQLENDEDDVKTVGQLVQDIDRSLSLQTTKDIIDVFQRCQSLPDDLKNFKGEVTPPDEIVTKLDEESLTSSVKELPIAELVRWRWGHVERHSKPELRQIIDTKVQGEQFVPDLTDVAAVSTDGENLVIAVDRKNKSIKVYKGQQLLHSLMLQYEPFGIADLGNNEILVTLPSEDSWQKILVYPTPTIKQIISTNRSHYGVLKIGEDMIAACRNPLIGKKTIDILDMDGKMLKTVDIGNFNDIRFSCVTSAGSILVSDSAKNSNIFIEMNIQEKTNPQCVSNSQIGTKDPRGIITTKSGDILLVCMGSHKVVLLTQSGEFVRDLLTSADALDKPRAICIDKDGLVYVTCGRFIQVYGFSKISS